MTLLLLPASLLRNCANMKIASKLIETSRTRWIRQRKKDVLKEEKKDVLKEEKKDALKEEKKDALKA